MNQIENQIKELILKVGELEAKELEEEATFFDDLQFDSIKLISLMLELEEELGIEFNDIGGFINNINNVRDFIEFVMDSAENSK